jgi:hypothetical protein
MDKLVKRSDLENIQEFASILVETLKENEVLIEKCAEPNPNVTVKYAVTLQIDFTESCLELIDFAIRVKPEYVSAFIKARNVLRRQLSELRAL